MKLILKPIQGGKTTEAVKLANETGAYLVVANMHMAAHVAHSFDLDRYPVTFAELIEKQLKGSWVRNVVIDNLDECLKWYLGSLKIEGVTLTAKAEESCEGCKSFTAPSYFCERLDSSLHDLEVKASSFKCSEFCKGGA